MRSDVTADPKLAVPPKTTFPRRLFQRVLRRAYDPIAEHVVRERTFYPLLLERLGPEPARLLHVGCGRGRWTIAVARQFPAAEVHGLDADAAVLDEARRNVGYARASVLLREGLAEELPYPAGYFSAVFSSLLFHHVAAADRHRALVATARVLVPGGTALLADFGPPQSAWTRAGFLGVQLAHGLRETSDNLRGKLPTLLREAGFADASILGAWPSVLGTVMLYEARVPSR